MEQQSDALKKRTKLFALRCIRLFKTLNRDPTAVVLGKQLLRSATSIGANYRAACRARSQADFLSKITVVEEEADESQYWLELMVESGTVPEAKVVELIKEAGELTAIFTASGKTARSNIRGKAGR